MKLISFEYKEFWNTAHSWTLERVTLAPINLLVGKNASGKSRVINVIFSLARLLSGQVKEVNFSGSFRTMFDNDGKKVEYKLDVDNSGVILEDFVMDGQQLLHRGLGGYGWLMAEDIEGKSVKMRFKPSSRELGVVARLDPVQHPYLQQLHDWGKSVHRYEFGKGMGHENLSLKVKALLPLPEVLATDQIVPIFESGVRRFPEEFINTIKSDMRTVGYEIEDLLIERPAFVVVQLAPPGELVGIAAKERDLPCVTDQHCMSQGMFRTLSLVIQFNYVLLCQKPGCVLVDDIGEGLDFERSCLLIDLLRSKARESDVQLILSTNDRFIMNKVPLEEWLILRRAGNQVRVRNYENSKEIFDEFKFTGLSNFDFFATDFLNGEPEEEAVARE